MLWSPALGSGLYLHAEGQSGMAHPFHLLIYRFLPLTAAINLEMLASYVAALGGMFLFLRHLSLRRDAAATGALLFAFSGFQLAPPQPLESGRGHRPHSVAAVFRRRADDEPRFAPPSRSVRGRRTDTRIGAPAGISAGSLAERRGAGMASRLPPGEWFARFSCGAGLRGSLCRRPHWWCAAAANSRGGANFLPRRNHAGVPRVILAAPLQSRAIVLAVRVQPADLRTGEQRVVRPRVRRLQRRYQHLVPVLDTYALESARSPPTRRRPALPGRHRGCPVARSLRRHLPWYSQTCPGCLAYAHPPGTSCCCTSRLPGSRRSRSKMRSRWPRVSEPSPCTACGSLAIPIAVGVTIEIAAGVMSGSPWANGLDLRLRSVTPALAGIAAAVGSAALLCRVRHAHAVGRAASDCVHCHRPGRLGDPLCVLDAASENFSHSPGDGLPSRPERRSRASRAHAHRQEQVSAARIPFVDGVPWPRPVFRTRGGFGSGAAYRRGAVGLDVCRMGATRRRTIACATGGRDPREHRPGGRSARNRCRGHGAGRCSSAASFGHTRDCHDHSR